VGFFPLSEKPHGSLWPQSSTRDQWWRRRTQAVRQPPDHYVASSVVRSNAQSRSFYQWRRNFQPINRRTLVGASLSPSIWTHAAGGENCPNRLSADDSKLNCRGAIVRLDAGCRAEPSAQRGIARLFRLHTGGASMIAVAPAKVASFGLHANTDMRKKFQWSSRDRDAVRSRADLFQGTCSCFFKSQA